MRQLAFYLIGLFLAGGLVVHQASLSGKPVLGGSESLDRLDIDPAKLDFGSVDVQENFSWVLPIRNGSAEAIQLKNIHASCRCTKVSPTEARIPPGEVLTVRLQLDLRPQPGAGSSLTREFQVMVSATAVCRGASKHLNWPVSGTVDNPLVFAEGLVKFHVDLENLAAGIVSAAEASFTSSVDLREVHASLMPRRPGGPSDLPLACSAVLITPRSGHIAIQVHGPASEGSSEFLATLNATAASNINLYPISIPVSVRFEGRYELTPACVVFGRVPIGESRCESVAIRSRNSEPFLLASFECASDSITVERSRDNAGSSENLTLLISKSINTVGAQVDTVDLRLRSASGREQISSLKVVSVGADPSADVE